MTLANEINALRDRVLAELNAIHDYYVDTRFAWGLVREFVEGGSTFTNTNTATGTQTTQDEFVAKSRGYVAQHLAEATFQQFISIFENFYLDLLRLWLQAYPQSLGAKQVDFKSVLEAPDKDAIILLVINRELNQVLYDRPGAWVAYLEDKAKLGCPKADEIDRITEAKASRDILVHNRGVASKTYELKAGRLARYRDGERIDIPEAYHREVWILIRGVVSDLATAASAKAGPDGS